MSWFPTTRIFRPGALRSRFSRLSDRPPISTSPRQMIVSPGATVRCQLRKRASSISSGLVNGRPKYMIDSAWPKCRSDQIQTREGFGSLSSPAGIRRERCRIHRIALSSTCTGTGGSMSSASCAS